MARVTRRAVLAAVGATVVAGLAARKWLAPVAGPGDGPVEPMGAGDAGGAGVGFRSLGDVVAVRPPAAVPALTLRTLDGAPVSLAAYAGRPTVLNFWATWCGPCVAELPELDRLAAGGRVAVLAVSADRGGAAVVRPFLAAHAVGHATVLLDQGGEAVQAMQVAGFPTTFLLGVDGKVHGRLEGPAAWGAAGERIAALTR